MQSKGAFVVKTVFSSLLAPRQCLSPTSSVLSQKFEDSFDASLSSFPPFGQAQDRLQRESSGPSKSWIPGRASYRQLARNDDLIM